jgi:tetratricopeptide (TPR) repeat protein
VINLDVDRSDVFVLAMHRRWGQNAPDAKPYSSYTEEEFHRAIERWKQTRSPEIFVFFKHVDPLSMADPGPQLQKVLAFRKSLEDTRQVLYRFFADEKAFAAEVDKHLRAYARGELPAANAPREAMVLPLEYIEAVTKAKAEAQAAVERAEAHQKHADAHAARAEKLALTLAEQAGAAALEGRVEEARQIFANAHEGTTNLKVLYLAYAFYHRTGDLKAAEDMVERRLAISGREAETAETAAAYGNLGIIYGTRGELDRAEEMLQKAFAIDEKLGRQEGMAKAYGNLGIIYQTRGELDRAEEMIKKSLTIEEKLGRQEGMASDYGNLGNIYRKRGELDRAEGMLKKSLTIYEKLGRQDGMATAYGNLGIIYRKRGELDRAEEMLKKSLAIDEKLGRQEGMANAYGNLGLIYQTRGELDQAEEMYRKALAIFKAVGAAPQVKEAQAWLDGLNESTAER